MNITMNPIGFVSGESYRPYPPGLNYLHRRLQTTRFFLVKNDVPILQVVPE